MFVFLYIGITATNPISYTIIQYSLVTDQILQKCSTLFNNNYGFWNHNAPLHSNNVLQTGSRVKLGVKRLHELMLFNDRRFLVVAETRSLEKDQFELIVVCSAHQGRGVAGTLLSLAKNHIQDVVAMGLVSSHPHAVMAICNAYDHEFVVVLPTTSVRRSTIPSSASSSNNSPPEKQSPI
ncbi:unnamed protein product [Adineta ricciae]|uniref:N-acetyltransferase domain-containing protein n=1 Tax=Adineta ricciae TaxID=249248 RepID=A0A816CSL7_ADIRI|nr:unnamed protein product [Adineta ricciae]